MIKWLQKIGLLLAVVTVMGHSAVPHQHHETIKTSAHHHGTGTKHHSHDHEEKKEESHSIFSFAQLDDSFVPVKFQDVKIDLPIVYLLIPSVTFHFEQISGNSITHSGYYKEYPPPGNSFTNLPSRAPPGNDFV